MKKLIAIDMDGTLIGETGISQEDKKAMLEAQEAGHIVAIVSGRSHESVLALLEEEGITNLPVSGSNGAITIVDNGEISRVSMPDQLVEDVYAHLEEQGYPFLIYTSEGVYSKHDFLDRVKSEFEQTAGAKGSPFESYEFMAEYNKNHGVITFNELSEVLEKKPSIFKVFVFLPNPQKKERCSGHISTLEDVMLTSSYIDNISISSSLGHKGTGLVALAEHFGIPLENTVAMGDNLNDLGMLKIAGLSIAMANAEPEVKGACHKVTLSNLESGVAHAIREFVLK
ncbi:MAG: HAD family hydrolase [Turicibacter sp.]|nr:HAD family hydrolase [Turicibacter sp.]